ncbi:MAG: hypothetical protein NWF00_10645 [Candidatus Bathyarchaeota archaeon]|nr:hypothetical protein [Candidatus Bathyarchaeota archaeon]
MPKGELMAIDGYWYSKARLPIIKCECGAEILLVPDVSLMSHAIDDHVEKHRKLESDPDRAEAVAERVRTFLIKQVLKKAAAQT